MPRCEDYPCCGHEENGCPDSNGQFPCATCGRKLPKNSTSSLCKKCLKRMDDDPDRDDRNQYDY